MSQFGALQFGLKMSILSPLSYENSDICHIDFCLYIVYTVDMMNRESCLRSLAYSFDLDYADVSDLADALSIDENYTILMPYLERAKSLEDLLHAYRNKESNE